MVAFAEGERLTFGDRREHLLSPGLKEPLHGATGYPHGLGRFLLLLPLEVAEAHRLQLVESEFDDLELRKRNARRLEEIESVDSSAVSKLLPAWHSISSIGCRFALSKERTCTTACICT
jgi:hypothetical protein